MNHRWIAGAVAAIAVCITLLAGSEARAQDAPQASAAARAGVAHSPCPYQAAAMRSPCPYQAAAMRSPCGRYGSRCRAVFTGVRWGATGTAVALLGTAVVFHVLAIEHGADLDRAYDARDPNHAMPLAQYPELRAMEADRQTLQNAAIGFYIGGGVLAALSTLLWLAPHHGCHGGTCAPRPAPVAFDVAPGSMRLSLTF